MQHLGPIIALYSSYNPNAEKLQQTMLVLFESRLNVLDSLVRSPITKAMVSTAKGLNTPDLNAIRLCLEDLDKFVDQINNVDLENPQPDGVDIVIAQLNVVQGALASNSYDDNTPKNYKVTSILSHVSSLDKAKADFFAGEINQIFLLGVEMQFVDNSNQLKDASHALNKAIKNPSDLASVNSAIDEYNAALHEGIWHPLFGKFVDITIGCMDADNIVTA